MKKKPTPKKPKTMKVVQKKNKKKVSYGPNGRKV